MQIRSKANSSSCILMIKENLKLKTRTLPCTSVCAGWMAKVSETFSSPSFPLFRLFCFSIWRAWGLEFNGFFEFLSEHERSQFDNNRNLLAIFIQTRNREKSFLFELKLQILSRSAARYYAGSLFRLKTKFTVGLSSDEGGRVKLTRECFIRVDISHYNAIGSCS